MSTFDDSPLKAARIAYEEALLADLLAYAAPDESLRTRAAIADLWAHFRDIRDDGTIAARMVRKAIDLGWRP